MLGFRASICRADSGTDLKKQEVWKKRMKKRPISHKIRAFVFQARDLPAADDDGMADPMILAFSSIEKGDKDGGVETEAKTVVMEKNCDPMFYEILDITIDATDGEPLPPFIFDVYD